MKKSLEYLPSYEDTFYHKMNFNFYKQKPGLYVPPRLIGKKCKKKDLVREFFIECDDVDDLTFEHNVMCWANKVKAREKSQE